MHGHRNIQLNQIKRYAFGKDSVNDMAESGSEAATFRRNILPPFSRKHINNAGGGNIALRGWKSSNI